MNRINFLQTGGYPLETDTFDELQKAFAMFNSLGALAGNKTIVSGCVSTGGNTSDGVVYLDGELFNFRGGQTQTTVKILEDTTTKIWENGDENVWHYERYVIFASGTGSIPWADFRRAYPLASALYKDKVDMFAGNIANIPAGWYVCNGQNGTVDLRGRFVVGHNPTDSDYDAVGKVGGLKQVILNESQMPSHTHSGSTENAGTHAHAGLTFEGSSRDSGNSGNLIGTNPDESNGMHTQNQVTTGTAGNHAHNLNINAKGGGQSHENRPPFYTLIFIQFKGI